MSHQEQVSTIEIPLTQGQVTIVDAIDSDLAQRKWYAQFFRAYANGGNFVAKRASSLKGKRTHEFIHRVIVSRMLGRTLLRTEYVDHINGNPLDNRRDNLRLATASQNGANRARSNNNTSGLKGVFWNKQRDKWTAQIQFNGKLKPLGCFDTPEEAHDAYKVAAKELFGEFANDGVRS